MIGIDKPSVEVLELSEDGTYGKFTMEPHRARATARRSATRFAACCFPHCPATRSLPSRSTACCTSFSTVPGVKEGRHRDRAELKRRHPEDPGRRSQDAVCRGFRPSAKCVPATFKTDSEVEILNPDHLIGDAFRGRNAQHGADRRPRTRVCVPAERNKQMMQPVIGVISLIPSIPPC